MEDRGKDKNYGEFLDRTAKLIKIELSREFKKVEANITPEQWVILSKLYENDKQSQSELGGSTYKDAPTVSRIIDLLCKKELTIRVPDKDDRRRFVIHITEKGTKTVEKALPIIKATRMKGWKGLSNQDYDDLLRIINKIAVNFTN